MDCPFCGKEMKAGTIPSRDLLKWRESGIEDTWGGGIALCSWTESTKAFLCPDCRQIVIPVPEIEGMWDKVQRKMDEASKKLGAVQKKWKEQREETQKQKKKEKLGKKDPWEL